jgi:hypothetical protein
VTKALPLVKNRPARAGKKAKAKGELCQWDRSSGAVESSWSRPREGRIKSPAECRVSSKLEKESSEERRREKEGSNGGAPSAAGWLVFADERLRSVKEGGRGRADDDAPATGVCEASSGEGGADVLKDGLVMVPVVKDWGKRELVHVIVLVRLAIVTALHELRVPSFSTGNRQSSWLPFWRAPNPPLRLASAHCRHARPGRSMRGSSSAILFSFASGPPTCSPPTILSYAKPILYQRDIRLPASCCDSSELCGWSVCCPLKHFSCTSPYL